MVTITGNRWFVRWSFTVPALHSSSSWLSFRIRVALSSLRVLGFGMIFMWLHTTSLEWVRSMVESDEVEVPAHGEGTMMTHV